MNIQEIDAHVGVQMRKRRRELGISMKQLAEQIGVTMQQIAKYETGQDSMRGTRVYQIAKALGVAPAALFPPLVAVSHTNPYHTEVMELAKTLSPDRLRRLNTRVLKLLAEEGGRGSQR